MSKPPINLPAGVDLMVDEKVAASLGGCCRSKLFADVKNRRFPAPAIRGGRFTRWRMSDIQAWIADPAGWIARNADAGNAVAGEGE